MTEFSQAGKCFGNSVIRELAGTAKVLGFSLGLDIFRSAEEKLRIFRRNLQRIGWKTVCTCITYLKENLENKWHDVGEQLEFMNDDDILNDCNVLMEHNCMNMKKLTNLMIG